MPSAFSLPRNSALNCINARAMPSFTASAWPRTPPPSTFAMMLNDAAVSVDASGAFAAERCAGVTKYSSNSRPFTLKSPLASADAAATFNVVASVLGGGVRGQADAVKLGIARALMQFNAELRKKLKSEGMVSRDSRGKERKKYGQKGARKRFQFSKR